MDGRHATVKVSCGEQKLPNKSSIVCVCVFFYSNHSNSDRGFVMSRAYRRIHTYYTREHGLTCIARSRFPIKTASRVFSNRLSARLAHDARTIIARRACIYGARSDRSRNPKTEPTRNATHRELPYDVQRDDNCRNYLEDFQADVFFSPTMDDYCSRVKVLSDFVLTELI